ncbi:MAG: queuosine precursor transporter [Flavobacteriales bacterium]
MNKTRQGKADRTYLILAALFITALVVCNLIANKFVIVNLGFYQFTLSAGVLPYPITFLITDILSEIYGRKKTNYVVMTGFAALVFTMLILWVGDSFRAIENSPVSDEVYHMAFGNSTRVIFASMAAYLVAQLVDVRLFHFWKRLTEGKWLWLRNNASTILSQLVDTTLVVLVLFYGKESFETMGDLIKDGWMFKALVALGDTPFIYLIAWLLRKQFKLKFGEEI